MSLSEQRKIPAVSIIMPVYNTPEEYLHSAIDSIRNQTWPDWELICVNDGFDERTAVILHQYEMTDSRIRCIKTNHVGAGFARNAGFAQAVGEAVLFLDSDDLFLPELLEKSYQNLIASSADITIFPFQFLEKYQKNKNSPSFGVQPTRTMSPAFETRDYLDALFFLTNAAIWNKLIRRDFLLKTGILFTNLVVTQDCLFTYSLLYHSRRISYLTEPFLLYRTGNMQSLMHTFSHIPEECCQAFLLIKQELEQESFWSQIQPSFCRFFLESVRSHYLLISQEDQKQFKERLKTVYFPMLGMDTPSQHHFTKSNRAFYLFLLDRKPWFGKKWGWPDKREIYFFKMKIFQYTRKKR